MNRDDFAALRPIDQLIRLMAMLRHPEHGCPWDLKQSFRSLTSHTIEEAYEVADAAERGALAELRDELGDLLLQIVFYAQIASDSSDSSDSEEAPTFTVDDIAAAIVAKLIRRHPHVFPSGDVGSFGQAPAGDAEQALLSWDEIKRQERGGRPSADHAGLLGEVAVALPALQRAGKLQGRAADVGFDWPADTAVAAIVAKLKEELAEYEKACAQAQNHDQASAAEREELGDLLFTVVNLCRHRGVDAEAVLRAANGKFADRFFHMEAAAAAAGQCLGDLSPAQLDALWEDAKSVGRLADRQRDGEG